MESFIHLVSKFKIAGSIILAVSGLLVAVWAVDDRYAKHDDVKESEARIVSEVRDEAADTRLILIEHMELLLDERDYDISILEASGSIPPQDLIIKRNMLDRLIQRLKNNENSNNDNG